MSSLPPSTRAVAFGALALVALAGVWTTHGQEPPPKKQPRPETVEPRQAEFREHVQPLLRKYCLRCHNAKEMKSGIRIDRLDGGFEDRQLRLWQGILGQLEDEAMPPEDEAQPTAKERERLTDWIQQTLDTARTRKTDKNGSVRRLTVAQYRNTLRELLGLREDLTDALPPDSVSKDGFVNNSETMLLSPLLVEAYFDIAEKALDLCIVDTQSKPLIQNFRMDLGEAINPTPCPDNLILGANSLLLENDDFQVTELKPDKPFDYTPFAMQTSYEFIEGYQGNATVRGNRKFDSIYHAVFACMRGTVGYPKGVAYQTIPGGLLLPPAIPSPELFGQSSTYGPMANFKISLRELPDHGNFRVTVRAARYEDALMLSRGASPRTEDDAFQRTAEELAAAPEVSIEKAGVYQVDVTILEGRNKEEKRNAEHLILKLGERSFAGRLFLSRPTTVETGDDKEERRRTAAFLLVRLPKGPHKVSVRYGDNARLRGLRLTRLDEGSDELVSFEQFEKRSPSVGVHIGLRRDCGSTLTRVGEPRAVSATEIEEFVFEGSINDFPSPDVEENNVNYLAGVREIGVRSEYTDGREMPRLLVHSIEFEGPYYSNWPPETHRKIFLESPNRNKPRVYAREIIRSFASRAFRRPIDKAEENSLMSVWKNSFEQSNGDFQSSIKDALLVVLTSPQFLFLIENSAGPEPEQLDAYELASKLSYFLWNAAPDARLLTLAATDKLHGSLDAELDRMLQAPQFARFVEEFSSQWLSLDKFDVVEIDRKRYPSLTRDTRAELRKEPTRFLKHLIDNNLPLENLIRSDFIVANEIVASYYGLGDRTESGFEFAPVQHDDEQLGGVLTQASILAGLSDGRESNPVKRGAWLARKIIAEPPEDPPPNVPQIQEDDGTKLTLRQKLERHRNQEGCVKCHEGIDPWGVPFEQFDAGGLFKKSQQVDARSTLPDKTEVQDLNGLKTYLAKDRIDRVAFSFLKHMATYAVGRSLTYNELVFLEEEALELKANGYRMQEMIRFVVSSDLFLTK